MPIKIGIVGAGNRGQSHAEAYGAIDDATVVAVADIDKDAARDFAETFDVSGVYEDFRNMLEEAALDAVSICVHNNLHRPVTTAAAEAGCHVFCEKPMAATYADAVAMADAVEKAGVKLGVQNHQLFSAETRAARRLIEDDKLGNPYYAQGVFSRRRGRPYISGYGTPAFVSTDSAGGGPVVDVGTYVIGKLLYLLGNAQIERVSGATFDHTDDTFSPELVGDNASIYEDRLLESGYDVEDAGMGFARLADGSLLSLRTAWHMFLPDESSKVAGSKGGIQLDPFKVFTTTADYEATVSIDLEDFERRQGLLQGENGYETDRRGDQFSHWIATIQGQASNPIPTGEIALNSMLLMEGIYLSEAAGRELTKDEIVERSESTAIDV